MGQVILVLGGRSHPELLAGVVGDLGIGGDSVFTTGAVPGLAMKPFANSTNVTLADVLGALEAQGEVSGSVTRAVFARLALIERVIMILPGDPTDWFALGAIAGTRHDARFYARLPLGVLVPHPSLLGPLRDLPVALTQAGVVTSDPERLVAWCRGMLFQSLLPKADRRQAKEH